jgi:hypothetical protein
MIGLPDHVPSLILGLLLLVCSIWSQRYGAVCIQFLGSLRTAESKIDLAKKLSNFVIFITFYGKMT